MNSFDDIKKLWNKGEGTQQSFSPDLSSSSKDARYKMQSKYKWGTISLALTGCFIITLAIFPDLNLQKWYTYGAMVLISLICFAQAIFLYQNYLKIQRISDLSLPADHLKQWEAYYALRKKQNKWNGPVYFLALNLAMAIYFIEIFSGRPILNVMIMLSIYFGWMAFAYFYIGKRVMKKEKERLNQIINELKELNIQFKSEQ
ncbi:hypothetical protein C9994_15140 [Marivirga lumbricoides]|uniref:Uncharacterized protein n=1 Tax=Marivirga lumbricoides TaxID=1046115 RepID=A0A2T4DD59_9BACT|nr:hypothetical protein C9994_15140 [Marivirga lumbricoides]